MPQTSIAIIGLGAIGRSHAETVQRADFCKLIGATEPSEAGRSFALDHGIPWFPDHHALLSATKPDAVIVATPNNTHLPIALDVMATGAAVLVEKPVTSTVAEGEALAAASTKSGVPVLVGHHRRHNPIITKARALVRGGELGRLTNVTVLYTHFKPDEYFAMEWRRLPGGGPILINLIHEIDVIRFVCGEIKAVQAITSHGVRGFPVEDTAAVILELENGALAAISLSDTAASPWSWDLSSGELANYPPQPAPVNSHYLSGTEGSLALPSLEFWNYRGRKSWYAEISREVLDIQRQSPYTPQLRHLCDVAARRVAPIIDAADGTRTLRATLAVKEAAQTCRRVILGAG